MKKWRLIQISLLVTFLVSTLSCPLDLRAADPAAEPKGFEKRVEKSMGDRALRGDTWQTMTEDCKIAFIWGAIHVVGIEKELMHKYPELKRDSFVGKFVEGMSDMPMKDVVGNIDEFYKTNPDKRDMAVLAVMWDRMIKPNIKTGIAGRPLEKKQ
jgi:hypothetical protein